MEYIITTVVIVVVAIILFAILASIVRIVPQSRAYVIEWLGAFRTVWGVGVHFKVPIVERVAKNVSLKEQVVDFPPQPVITKDNVTMQIDHHADRYGDLFPDHRPQALHLWGGKSHVRH